MYVGIAMGIFGHPEYVRRHIENNPGLSPLSSDPLLDDFNAEKDRAVAELKKPTVADLQNDCDAKTRWLETFNLEEKYQGLIKKYQDKVSVGAD